jgi:hypothetical protein
MSRSAAHTSFGFRSVRFALGFLSLSAVALVASPASAQLDISDWTGFNNTSSGTNYGLINPTTAGGSLTSKFNGAGSYFADTRLNLPGGWLSYDTNVGITTLDEAQFKARVTFANNDHTQTDPALVIGYFNQDSITGLSNSIPNLRAGITFADNTAGTFRVQAVGRQSNGQVTKNIGVLENGTYDFIVDMYPGTTDNVRVQIYDLDGVFLIENSISLPGTVRLDSFGIMQPGFPGTTTLFPYDVAITNVSYTGSGAINYAVWNGPAGGEWTVASNWDDAAVPVIGAPVLLGSNITAASTLQLDSSAALDELIFDSAAAYSISGSGQINFDFGAPNAVAVVQGQHAVNVPVGLFKSAQFDVAGGSSVALNAGVSGSGKLTKSGTGTLSAQRVRTAGGLVVAAGTLQLSGTGDDGTSVVPTVVVNAGATLDVGRTSMIVDYAGSTSSLSALLALLADGRLTAASLGAGGGVAVLESTALGSPATFGGQAYTGGAVFVVGTLKGDWNLDRTVNFTDLLVLAQNYNGSGNWLQGDGNYDSTIDFLDLLVLAQNYNQSALESLDGFSVDFQADWQLARSFVPEPVSLSALMALAALGTRRRRVG